MTTYVVATAEPPTIDCPPWCDRSVENHLDDLEGLDGEVIHAAVIDGVHVTHECFVDGTPIPDMPTPEFRIEARSPITSHGRTSSLPRPREAGRRQCQRRGGTAMSAMTELGRLALGGLDLDVSPVHYEVRDRSQATGLGGTTVVRRNEDLFVKDEAKRIVRSAGGGTVLIAFEVDEPAQTEIHIDSRSELCEVLRSAIEQLTIALEAAQHMSDECVVSAPRSAS